MSAIPKSPRPFQTERDLLALVRILRYERLSLDKLALPKDLYDAALLSPPLPAAQLLNPILVSKNGPGTFEILDGCKRFVFLRREKSKECVCGIAAALSPLQKGLIRILLNRERALSIHEQFLFYSWLTTVAGLKDKDDVTRFLGLPWNQLSNLDELLKSPHDVRSAVFENRLHAGNAADFGLLSEKDRKQFLKTFKGLGLSLQTEREFIQWMPEIIHARNSTTKDFSGFIEIESIANDAGLNAPQKIQKINSLLRALRFPRFESTLKSWDKLSARVNPDKAKVCFIASPYFEKNRLEVRLVVSKPQEALDILKKLCGIPETAWSSLIHPQ
jgi:hypothetical protein